VPSVDNWGYLRQGRIHIRPFGLCKVIDEHTHAYLHMKNEKFSRAKKNRERECAIFEREFHKVHDNAISFEPHWKHVVGVPLHNGVPTRLANTYVRSYIGNVMSFFPLEMTEVFGVSQFRRSINIYWRRENKLISGQIKKTLTNIIFHARKNHRLRACSAG
jgi:hypothetical protein